MLFTLVGYKKKQAQKETLSQLQDYLEPNLTQYQWNSNKWVNSGPGNKLETEH